MRAGVYVLSTSSYLVASVPPGMRHEIEGVREGI